MFVSGAAGEQAGSAISLVVPDRAIGFDQSKKFLFVVSTASKVKYREVELGHAFGGQRVVLKGIQAGERVIVDGLQRVRADAAVQATEIPATATRRGYGPAS